MRKSFFASRKNSYLLQYEVDGHGIDDIDIFTTLLTRHYIRNLVDYPDCFIFKHLNVLVISQWFILIDGSVSNYDNFLNLSCIILLRGKF